jgi:tetratricopeptide (TPR) repeat protein
VIKRIIARPFFNLSKLLILYFLFQALVFDVIFHFFFFFIFLFLLKNLFERRVIYKSFTLPLKVYAIFLLIIASTAGFILPYFSHQLIEKSQKTRDIVRHFELLNKAEYVNSLDAQVHYLKGIALFHYFRESNNLESFYSALKQLKEAQRLNPYLIDTYRLESDIYTDLFQKKINYMGLCADMTAPLTAAEQYDPLNPFIKLRKAEIFLRFNLKEEARKEVLEALALEPEYVAALYFLQSNFDYFEEGIFEKRIARIKEKGDQYQPERGTYLYELFKIPIEKGR